MILLRLVSRQTVSLQAVKKRVTGKNASKMPKFLHTKCRQASKQAHPPLEMPLQYYKNTERKKEKRMTEKTTEKKKKTK